MRGSRLRNRNTNSPNSPYSVAEEKPTNACRGTHNQSCTPTPALAQEQEQEIREIELLFDRQSPEDAVDAVSSLRIQVVQHEHVHTDVVDEAAGHFDPNRQRRQQ